MTTNNNNHQVKSNKQDYKPIKKRHVAGILRSPSLRLSLGFFFFLDQHMVYCCNSVLWEKQTKPSKPP